MCVSHGFAARRISGLKWQDVDFLAGVIRPQQAVWNGQECGLKSKAAYKPLPLPQKLREALLELRAESKFRQDGDYVFTARNGKPVNLSNLGEAEVEAAPKETGAA